MSNDTHICIKCKHCFKVYTPINDYETTETDWLCNQRTKHSMVDGDIKYLTCRNVRAEMHSLWCDDYEEKNDT